MGELVISANNNICTLFSSSRGAKERSTASAQRDGVVMWVQLWGGKGKEGESVTPMWGCMERTSLRGCSHGVCPYELSP